MLERVSADSQAWEQYARGTFLAHAKIMPPQKLRFLQYVRRSQEGWWEAQKEKGAVLL